MLYKYYRFKNIQPSDSSSFKEFLKQQFFIYEIDEELKILQQVKIPKSVFKIFAQAYPRYEFCCLMAFRLSQDDLDFFKTHCNFHPINPQNCFDVFTKIPEYVEFNLSTMSLKTISREDFRKVCQSFPREYPYEFDASMLEKLRLILQKPKAQNAFFVTSKLSLIFQTEDDYICFSLKDRNKFYERLFHHFEFFHSLPIEDSLEILKEFKIEFIPPKNAKFSFGHSRAYDLKTIGIALQYPDHFEIYQPTPSQRQALEKEFYRPIPNTNFLLGVYPLGRQRFLMPSPCFELYIYDNEDEDNEPMRLKLDLDLIPKAKLRKLLLRSWNGFSFGYLKLSKDEAQRISKRYDLDIDSRLEKAFSMECADELDFFGQCSLALAY